MTSIGFWFLKNRDLAPHSAVHKSEVPNPDFLVVLKVNFLFHFLVKVGPILLSFLAEALLK